MRIVPEEVRAKCSTAQVSRQKAGTRPDGHSIRRPMAPRRAWILVEEKPKRGGRKGFKSQKSTRFAQNHPERRNTRQKTGPRGHGALVVFPSGASAADKNTQKQEPAFEFCNTCYMRNFFATSDCDTFLFRTVFAHRRRPAAAPAYLNLTCSSELRSELM
jgi:hypothetical protein